MRLARLLPLLFSLLSPLAAWAAEQPPAPPSYRIELLVFLRDAAPGGENWPLEPTLPDPAKAVATVQGGMPYPADTTDSSVAPATAPSLVTPLPESAYTLDAHAESLRREGLTPLLHVAWRQPVHDRDNNDWLWLDAGAVRGLVRVSLGRYLHLDTDLAQQTSGMEADAIHSIDHRRMRSGELHYLDQPGFGILAIIQPDEPAEPLPTPAPAS